MGLREQFAADYQSLNPTGCRVKRWLDGFDGDDRDFLIETFESQTPTDSIIRFIRTRSLEPLSKDLLNDHRWARCTCPDDAPGRRA